MFQNKPEKHIRKYLGIVLRRGEFNYFVPFSSPKETDYILVDGKRIVRKSIIPIIRMTANDLNGESELKGTLKLSNMIPVPESELTLYDIKGEQDSKSQNPNCLISVQSFSGKGVIIGEKAWIVEPEKRA